ncbi:MAG: TonB-dependent receptor [Bacteroidota bacterium]
MKKVIAFFTLWLLASYVFSQNLNQTVRGTVIDADSKLPIVGVVVKIAGSNPAVGTFTNANGEFILEKVPVGSIALQLTYIGYEPKTIPDIEVNSGKEKILNLSMQEALKQLKEVVVTNNKLEKGAAINEMSLISTRSISLEESKRYAGSFNDPARILTNFAGVTNSQNGENDIIVRGNSPKYIQWRLEGVEISNPTHFADQNSVKGGISALNNSLLATSDFSTGAFSPEYGDVLSGVYDVKLRAGNNKKRECTLGLGIIGTEITLEGPFKKGYGGSFLFNYRYSTVSLISKLGAVDLPGTLNFQDAAFKIVLPTKKLGVFSLFGLGGLSGFELKDVKADLFPTPTNKTNIGNVREDYDKDAFLSNYGLGHTFTLNKKSFVQTALSYSDNGIMEDIFRTKTIKIYDGNGVFVRDSVGNKLLDYKTRLTKSAYRAAVTYNYKANAKNTFQIGSKYALMGYDYNLSHLPDSTNVRFTLVNMNEYIGTVRNFISWKHRFNQNITMVAGFHNMNVLYNHKSTLEPRIAFNWKINPSNAINIGYGKHSTMESVHNYFAKVKQADGSITEPNKNLDLLKADHYVLGYEKRFGKNIRFKTEVYYQYLYNLPVENNDTSYYATINEGTDFNYVNLVNKGTGQNYGLEITLERFFDKNYYFLINASLYESKYKSLEGIERNTLYNGQYLINALAGKDFTNLGKNKNQTLSLNVKMFFAGGQKYIPLLRDANGKLAVDPANNRFWNYKKAYNQSLDNVYEITLSVNYKWNKPTKTHELYVNLQNLTSTQARITEYYDTSKSNSVGYLTQFGFFPNVMYRLYF